MNNVCAACAAKDPCFAPGSLVVHLRSSSPIDRSFERHSQAQLPLRKTPARPALFAGSQTRTAPLTVFVSPSAVGRYHSSLDLFAPIVNCIHWSGMGHVLDEWVGVTSPSGDAPKAVRPPLSGAVRLTPDARKDGLGSPLKSGDCWWLNSEVFTYGF